MKKDEIKLAIKKGFPLSLPIMAGYEILGFGFGLYLHSAGYSVIWAFFMSLFIYAGSMQYVAVDLLASGAGLIATGIMTFMVNARHLFYGFSMLLKYKNLGKAKPYIIFGLTDEVFSVVSHIDPPDGVRKEVFYLVFTLMNHFYWISGSVLGAIFGTIVPLNTTGVEFSMTALFVVIVLDNLLKSGSRMTSLIGIGCSVVCLLIFGANSFLIPSMIAISIMLILCRPLLEKEKEAEHA